MRKHIIRVLTLVLFACFGLAIMTACNKDNKKPNDQTYTVTYVAGGGTGTAPQS